MSSPEEPQRPDPQTPAARRLIWAGGTVVALWFIADGVKGIWPGVGTVARVVIAAGVVLVLLAVGLGVLTVVKRDREG